MSEFVLPEGAFDLPTEVGLSDSPGLTTGAVRMAAHDLDSVPELDFSFAEPVKGGGLKELALDVDPSEPAVEGLAVAAPDPAFLAMIDPCTSGCS